MRSTKQQHQLDIIIAGAGIGGLAAAVGLRREGHNVRIFEKRKLGNEVGAAIVIPANIYGLLKRLGVDPEEHGSNREDIRSFYTKDGALMFESDLTGFGGAASLMHRVDLHNALKGAAVAEGVQIDYGDAIILVDPEAGSVSLSDGQNITADVVIGADGIHSVVRKAVVPNTASPYPFQLSMFRMLIPCSKLNSSPETARFIDPPGKMTIFHGDDGRRVVNYPCRSNTVMNVAALFPTSLAKTYPNDTELKNHMLDIYSDFTPSTIALLTAAEEIKIWTLYLLPALSTWSRGRTAIMGDAAHPTLPIAAQGGAQALEDAATLAVVLGRGTTPEQVAERLRVYFEIRHERADWVQEFALTGEQSTLRDSVVKPSMDPSEFYEKVQNHDAWKFAEEKLREHVGGEGK